MMQKMIKIAAAGLMLATVFGAAPQAFAWACQAQANDGASGYSYIIPTAVAHASARSQNAMRTPTTAAMSPTASATADSRDI